MRNRADLLYEEMKNCDEAVVNDLVGFELLAIYRFQSIKVKIHLVLFLSKYRDD